MPAAVNQDGCIEFREPECMLERVQDEAGTVSGVRASALAWFLLIMPCGYQCCSKSASAPHFLHTACTIVAR
jgi:hypothetical protein